MIKTPSTPPQTARSLFGSALKATKETILERLAVSFVALRRNQTAFWDDLVPSHDIAMSPEGHPGWVVRLDPSDDRE